MSTSALLPGHQLERGKRTFNSTQFAGEQWVMDLALVGTPGRSLPHHAGVSKKQGHITWTQNNRILHVRALTKRTPNLQKQSSIHIRHGCFASEHGKQLARWENGFTGMVRDAHCRAYKAEGCLFAIITHFLTTSGQLPNTCV